MIAVLGRVLPAPRVMYFGNSTAGTVGGSWNMKNKKVLKPKTFSDWTILRIGAAANIKNTEFERQCKALTEGFRSSGFHVNAPQFFPGPSIPAFDENRDDAVAFVDSNLRAILESCKAKNIGALLVVLSSTKPWIYARVKFLSDVTYGTLNAF